MTVQLPGGERVAFLFTIKQLAATGTLDSFSGDFTVPSYRGSSFLDPKVRGTKEGGGRFRAEPWGNDDMVQSHGGMMI